MADRFTADISDLNKFSAELSADAGRVRAAAAAAVRKAAFDTEALAKTLVPVDTGNLRSSISTTIDGLTAEVGPTAEYGAHVEYGTARQAPAAYMGPAADRVAPSFVQAMKNL